MHYVFADCRWSLLDHGFGRAAYVAGHIPAAVFVDVEAVLASPAGADGRHPLPDTDTFALAMGGLGIDDGTFVVAYGSLGGAERLWWLLRHFGHDRCAVIDLDAWRGPFSTGEEQSVSTVFEPRPRSDDTIGREELAARLGDLIVVDARVPARWRGEANPIDIVPGRIPGALNRPWDAPPAELPPGELVAYCGSGMTACVVLHRLHLTGRDGRLYPGSWSEWELHPELPREGDQAAAE